MRSRRGRALRRRYGRSVMRYSHQDIAGMLINSPKRPAWEREAHMVAAAKQRGYQGSATDLHGVERFLDGVVFGGGGQ
jgi:hypothetical protein